VKNLVAFCNRRAPAYTERVGFLWKEMRSEQNHPVKRDCVLGGAEGDRTPDLMTASRSRGFSVIH